MRRTKDRRTRALVASSRFYANEAVLNNIDTADAVLAGEGIESKKYLNAFSPCLRASNDLGGKSLCEMNYDLLGMIRRIFRRVRQLPHVSRGSCVRIFENASFIRDVEKVFI